MLLRPFVFAIAALAAAGVQADPASRLTTGSRLPPTYPGSSEPVGPEEVVVAAPEPRYVAPTLRDRIGRVWAPVYINGVGPFRLVLDTGANRSVVTRSVADRIGVPILHDSKARLHGVTGSSIVPTIHVDSLEVGDLWLDRQRLPIVEDVFGGAEGVLGADGLADKRIFIDFRNDEISIRYSRGRGTLPFGYTRVPVKMREGHLLMFDVFLAGVRTKALLDTGAQSTIGNNSLREALARRAKQGVPDSIVGVTLDVQEGRTFRAPPVTIADITIKGMRVTFGDIYIFDAWKMNDKPAILIGMDIIGLLDSMIIDYKNKELQLRARR
jgi:predicted aspartyl protease